MVFHFQATLISKLRVYYPDTLKYCPHSQNTVRKTKILSGAACLLSGALSTAQIKSKLLIAYSLLRKLLGP